MVLYDSACIAGVDCQEEQAQNNKKDENNNDIDDIENYYDLNPNEAAQVLQENVIADNENNSNSNSSNPNKADININDDEDHPE
jgi:hypothetical protein